MESLQGERPSRTVPDEPLETDSVLALDDVAGDHAVEGRHMVVVVGALRIFDAKCLRRERTPDALREGNRSELRVATCGRRARACVTKRGPECPEEDAEHATRNLGRLVQEGPKSPGHGEHPLPDGKVLDHLIGQVGRHLRHAPRARGGADAPTLLADLVEWFTDMLTAGIEVMHAPVTDPNLALHTFRSEATARPFRGRGYRRSAAGGFGTEVPTPESSGSSGCRGGRVRHLSRNVIPMPEPISPAAIARTLTEFWSPRVIAEVDDCYVKVAKLRGTLTWHAHDDEDELFYVISGRLRIELEAGAVELGEGDLFVVPKGVRHNPVAEEECHVLLIERKTTLHTGGERTEMTRSIEEQLRPV